MFNFHRNVITKVFNPLNITHESIIEFEIGELKDTGIYRFRKIVEFTVGDRTYTRYLIYSKTDNTEYILEAFPGSNDQMETYLYSLTDTVPFTEEFFDVAGQRYLTTPDGDEYTRCIMPEDEDRIDGLQGKVRVYNIETRQVEKEYTVKLWDYQRDNDGTTVYLNIEMSEENGLFRIFTGELIEDIFYKLYQTEEK